MFGNIQEIPQTEETPFYPRSPYGVAKLYAYWICVNYREAYDIFAVNGILFNHESPVRGETFVTRKITRAAVRIAEGVQDKLFLGNLNAKRDWGHAKDYVRGMWLMLQQEKPEDFVLATGKTHTVRELCTHAFKTLDIEIEWKGEGVNEKGINKSNGDVIVEVDQRYFRPTEVDILIGDASKAQKKLEWEPQYTFEELITDMISSDMDRLKAAASNNNSGG